MALRLELNIFIKATLEEEIELRKYTESMQDSYGHARQLPKDIRRQTILEHPRKGNQGACLFLDNVQRLNTKE